ncbi:cytoskeletal protein binding protein [Tulasnella sp. 408]|nr:cytoskeletal protein binding protein [Tulasnella sp. 408]
MAEEVVFRDVVQAVHDYTATAFDQLTVKEDQLLFVLEILDENWVKVQVHMPFEAFSEAEPAAGLVPSSSIAPATPLYRAVALRGYEPNGWEEVIMKGNETMDVYFKEDERILVKIDRKATVPQPAIGYVPANYVKKAEDDREVPADLAEVESEDQTAIVVAVASTPRGRGITVIALYDFEALEDDELTVKEDERLTVLNDENEDWWQCCNLKGEEGLVPAAYLDIESAG